MQSAQFQLHAQIEERHWWFVARRQILRELVRRMTQEPLGDQPVAVDIGCGTGANLAAFADEFRCIGIDTCAEAIELASRRFPEATFVCGQAPKDVNRWLAVATIVLLTDVLEHVSDDLGLLKSIVNACAPGTLILISVPADMRLWSPHDVAFGHYRRYDPHGLSELWQGLPIRTRLLSHFNSRLYPLVWIAALYQPSTRENGRRGKLGFFDAARAIESNSSNDFCIREATIAKCNRCEPAGVFAWGQFDRSFGAGPFAAHE